MQKNPSNKKSSLKVLLIILGVAVLIFIIVLVTGGGSDSGPTPSTGLVTQSSTGASVSTPGALVDDGSVAGRRSDEIVALLNSVNSIDLDYSIFEHPAYTRLRSISGPLDPDRNPGRSNPFMPIGRDNVTTATTTTITQTSQEEVTTTLTDEGAVTGATALDLFSGSDDDEG